MKPDFVTSSVPRGVGSAPWHAGVQLSNNLHAPDNDAQQKSREWMDTQGFFYKRQHLGIEAGDLQGSVPYEQLCTWSSCPLPKVYLLTDY